LSGKSCWVLVYSALLLLLFPGNPIWPDSIPDGWELEWEQVDDEWYSMDGLPCVSSASFYFHFLNSESPFTFMYENLVCNNLNLWIFM
jgi:hypothetical protein